MRASVSLRGLIWFLYAIGALLLLEAFDLSLWSAMVVVGAALLWAVPRLRPEGIASRDGADLTAVIVLYVAVVALFRVAFTVFTTDNVLGLFLTFAGGLLLGVAGPVVYEVWVRNRDLTSLGIGLHRLPQTVTAAVVLGGIQFAMTLWGYDLPAPVDWVPLLVMSLVVGLFEAVFFRGFIQNRLEASLGTVAGIAGAALLYSLYHVGYGMGAEEMWFLFGLGVVYAIVFRLTDNILVLWPLLTPLGAFFNNLEAGDIELPWASIAGFADVFAAMAIMTWLTQRHLRKRSTGEEAQPLENKDKEEMLT